MPVQMQAWHATWCVMLSATGYWLLATGYWLLATGYCPLPTTHCPLSCVLPDVLPCLPLCLTCCPCAPPGPDTFLSPVEAAMVAELNSELADVLQCVRFTEALRAAVRWADLGAGRNGSDAAAPRHAWRLQAEPELLSFILCWLS